MSRLIVFEGVFDPPHIGHYLVVQKAKEELGGHVLVCPSTSTAAQTISKKANSSSYEHRMALCQLGFPNALIYRHTNTYTYDLVMELKHKFDYLDMTIIHGPDWNPECYHDFKKFNDCVKFRKINVPEISIRSTLIREKLVKGVSITGLVLPAVEIMLGNHVYNNQNSMA